MADRFGRPLDVAISIEKRIPAGGGLGGASADAAAVLVGLAQLWGIVPDAASDAAAGDPAVLEIARRLGADVPFFLEGGAALFTGRGDVLALALPALGADVVLVKPVDPVPTAAAYAAFDRLAVREQPPSPELLVRALGTGNAAAVASALFNNMTAASTSLVPGIRDAFALLAADSRVLGSAMAGSGSTVFGICEDGAAAARIADAARERGFWAAASRLSPSGCTIRGA
jgi:4-diphosphocytidyl-2-C-methyl-D-erythritol kinase